MVSRAVVLISLPLTSHSMEEFGTARFLRLVWATLTGGNER